MNQPAAARLNYSTIDRRNILRPQMTRLAQCPRCRTTLPEHLAAKHPCEQVFRHKMAGGAARQSAVAAKAAAAPAPPVTATAAPPAQSPKAKPRRLTEPLVAEPDDMGDPRVVSARQAQQSRSYRQMLKNRDTAIALARYSAEATTPARLKTPRPAKLGRPQKKTRQYGDRSFGLQNQKVRARVIPPPISRVPPDGVSAAPAPVFSNPNVQVHCPCSGSNERCFRCFGFGYYEISPEEAARLRIVTSAAAPPKGGADFAADGRGEPFGIREAGRFASSPEHDDYADDSHS